MFPKRYPHPQPLSQWEKGASTPESRSRAPRDFVQGINSHAGCVTYSFLAIVIPRLGEESPRDVPDQQADTSSLRFPRHSDKPTN